MQCSQVDCILLSDSLRISMEGHLGPSRVWTGSSILFLWQNCCSLGRARYSLLLYDTTGRWLGGIKGFSLVNPSPLSFFFPISHFAHDCIFFLGSLPIWCVYHEILKAREKIGTHCIDVVLCSNTALYSITVKLSCILFSRRFISCLCGICFPSYTILFWYHISLIFVVPW